MSDNSKEIAKAFEAAKAGRQIFDQVALEKKKLLNEGFERLKANLIDAIETLCEELNHEPQIGNMLVSRIVGDQMTVTRTDNGSVLQIKFDSFKYNATLTCEMAAKFRYVVQVKDGLDSWWFADAKGSSISMEPWSWVADKSLRALLGVPS